MIDEKKLIEDIEKEFVGVCVYDVSPSQAVTDFIEIVDRQPIIDKQPRVGEWKRTAEEKPDYTRHVIITYGNSRHASKYGYYFKKEDKWYRDHRCIEEIEPPYAWTEMPEVPEEFVCGMCCG